MREWIVTVLGDDHKITYDGRGTGYESVLLDDSVFNISEGQHQKTRFFWFVPRFEFRVRGFPSSLDVRVDLLLRVRACRLTIAGEVVYLEGRF